MPIKCYIALGSNLNHPARQLCTALKALNQLPATRLLQVAPFYRSRALGPGIQADYLNTVAELSTGLDALMLLKKLQAIERAQGRRRIVRWGPRTLDLDILLYGKQSLNSARLTIPHPRMQLRNFVLLPLADIAPELVLPDGRSLRLLLANCDSNGIVRLDAGEYPGSAG